MQLHMNQQQQLTLRQRIRMIILLLILRLLQSLLQYIQLRVMRLARIQPLPIHHNKAAAYANILTTTSAAPDNYGLLLLRNITHSHTVIHNNTPTRRYTTMAIGQPNAMYIVSHHVAIFQRVRNTQSQPLLRETRQQRHKPMLVLVHLRLSLTLMLTTDTTTTTTDTTAVDTGDLQRPHYDTL